jgi:hypothetical protein
MRQVIQKIAWNPPAGGASVVDMAFVGNALAVLRSNPEKISEKVANVPAADPTNMLITAIRGWSRCNQGQCYSLTAGDVAFIDRGTGGVISYVAILRALINQASPYSYSATVYGAVVSVNPEGTNSVIVTHDTGTTFRFTLNGAQISVSQIVTLSETQIKDTKFVDGTLWMISEDSGLLVRVDTSKKEVLGKYPTMYGAKNLLHDGRRVWVSTKDRLMQFNAFDGSKVGEIGLGVSASTLAFDGVNVYVADKNSGNIKTF